MGDVLTLDPIRRVGFAEADRATVEDNAIIGTMSGPTAFLYAYDAEPRSFGGRYIAADLFKELFPAYAASPAARNRYNVPVHNCAAVLAAAQFRKVCASTRDRDLFMGAEAIKVTPPAVTKLSVGEAFAQGLQRAAREPLFLAELQKKIS